MLNLGEEMHAVLLLLGQWVKMIVSLSIVPE